MAFAAKHDSLDALNADLQKIDPSKAVAFKVALIRQLTETASRAAVDQGHGQQRLAAHGFAAPVMPP
jgi:hypothetical protein